MYACSNVYFRIYYQNTAVDLLLTAPLKSNSKRNNQFFHIHLCLGYLFSTYYRPICFYIESGKIVFLLDIIYIYLLSYQFDLNFDINSLNEIKNIPSD